MRYDTILVNPLIFDGTGQSPFRNDVGLLNGRITTIGNLSKAQAELRIEAGSLALAPGFIDVHSHAEMTMVRPDHPSILEPLLRQGITTFVGGNCGVSMGPISETKPELQFQFYDFFLGEPQEEKISWKSFGEMLDTLEHNGMVMNAAILAPHGILRMGVMGDSTEVAKRAEIEAMKAILADCLEAGAVGMSTGLMYFPGLSSDSFELTELARVVHDYNGVFTSHLRSYNSDTLDKAIDEVLTIGRQAEVPVQISHLFWIPNLPKPFGTLSDLAIRGLSRLYEKRPFTIPMDGFIKAHMQKIEAQIAKGQPIGVDVMPTTTGFTHLLAFFPPWSIQGGLEAVKRRLADPQERRKIRQSIENGNVRWPHREGDSWSMNLFKVMGWRCASIMSVKSAKNQRLIGRNLDDIGRETGRHPFDVACDLLLEEEGRVLVFETATYPGDPLIEQSLLYPLLSANSSIVTDTILLGFGLPSNLFYDAFPRFISQYARDKKLIRVAEAIRKCSSLPARQLKLPQRGEIREGYHADLLLFDLERLAIRSSVQDPCHFPEGIHTVFVNGRAVVDPQGFHPEPRAGQLIRRGA